MIKDILLKQAEDSDKKKIIELLRSEKLPTEDLSGSLEHFIVAREGDELLGLVGLELYGHYGLLRSLVVNSKYRNQSVAGKLIIELENIALKFGIGEIYLLTETALVYFKRKGYSEVSRNEVPVQVQQSSEFSHVCPASAVVMKKLLNK